MHYQTAYALFISPGRELFFTLHVFDDKFVKRTSSHFCLGFIIQMLYGFT